jgi:hypothetical protein
MTTNAARMMHSVMQTNETISINWCILHLYLIQTYIDGCIRPQGIADRHLHPLRGSVVWGVDPKLRCNTPQGLYKSLGEGKGRDADFSSKTTPNADRRPE